MSETNEILHIPWHETFSWMLVHELELKKMVIWLGRVEKHDIDFY